MRVHLEAEDRQALDAFGLSSLTTGSVFVEPRWEYLPARAITTRRRGVQAPSRGSVGQYGNALQAFADDAAAFVMPAPNVVMGASVDPMSAHPWSMELEHAATRFLALHGERAPRPDVWSKRHRRHVPRPDAVAYKGTPRYVPPAPCRYGAFSNEPAAVVAHHPVFTGSGTGVVDAATQPVVELLTTLTGGTGRERKAWRGHRAIVITLAPRTGRNPVARTARQAVARAERAAAGATAARGKAVTPWAMAARSLPVACRTAGVADAVAALESIVRTSADGAAIALSDGTTITVMGAAQVVAHDRAYPVREWARRAALAGLAAE